MITVGMCQTLLENELKSEEGEVSGPELLTFQRTAVEIEMHCVGSGMKEQRSKDCCQLKDTSKSGTVSQGRNIHTAS